MAKGKSRKAMRRRRKKERFYSQLYRPGAHPSREEKKMHIREKGREGKEKSTRD